MVEIDVTRLGQLEMIAVAVNQLRPCRSESPQGCSESAVGMGVDHIRPKHGGDLLPWHRSPAQSQKSQQTVRRGTARWRIASSDDSEATEEFDPERLC